MSQIVVAGGGPAGAAVAAILAGAGREVLVVERDEAPTHKICGDFLSVEAQRALARLGVDLAPLAPAPIETIRLVHGNRVAAARLPFPALGLSRRTLDGLLLDHAARLGATVLHGSRLTRLEADGARLTLRGQGGALRPETLFLATGKHELRGAARRRTPMARSVAFKTYLSLTDEQTEALRGAVELMLFEGGYAGLLLVERGIANLSLVVSTERLARAGGRWEVLLDGLQEDSPHLARRLGDARPLLPRPLAVSRIPYGFVHLPCRDDPPGIYRVGDQAAVIPSLTGNGVAIALHSARRAAEAYLAGRSAADHHAALRADLRWQMRRASVLNRACLAPALQPALVAACALLPGAMQVAAAWTRIPRHVEASTPSPLPLPRGEGRG